MLVLHGLAGLCIVVGAFRQREPEFQVEGANAFHAVLLPMAVLVLVLPNFLVSVPRPFYSPLQLAFVSVACLGLYTAFLFIQTNWHRRATVPIPSEVHRLSRISDDEEGLAPRTSPFKMEKLRGRLLHRPQAESGRTLANLSTVRVTFVGRVAEVEPNEDARICVLGRRLGKASI
jgi:Sodium/calcium exchanger protein